MKHIVYTSVMGADKASNPAIVKLDHRATEEIIEASGLAYTFLRDSQYAEAIAMAVIPPCTCSVAACRTMPMTRR